MGGGRLAERAAFMTAPLPATSGSGLRSLGVSTVLIDSADRIVRRSDLLMAAQWGLSLGRLLATFSFPYPGTIALQILSLSRDGKEGVRCWSETGDPDGSHWQMQRQQVDRRQVGVSTQGPRAAAKRTGLRRGW
jgi:hypothetical protein